MRKPLPIPDHARPPRELIDHVKSVLREMDRATARDIRRRMEKKDIPIEDVRTCLCVLIDEDEAREVGVNELDEAVVTLDVSEVREDIIHHMSMAFFASAWADYEDRHGEGTGGSEIMDIMPDDIDPSATKAAEDLSERMEKQYGAALPELLERAKGAPCKYADRACDPEYFGHYAAMQAMGHGVGLERVCDRSAFPDFPYIEFSYYELDPDKFPIPADEEE